MARKNRITTPDGVYHVTARIAHGAMLFRSDDVKDRIVETIRDVAEFSGVELYDWCVMENHLHLLVHVPRVPERYWLNPAAEPDAYAFGMRPPECRTAIWTAPSGVDTPHDGGCPNTSIGDTPCILRHIRPPVGFSIPDDEMVSRLVRLYGKTRAGQIAGSWRRMRSNGLGDSVEEAKSRYCRRMYNLSQFVKTLSETVARRYNAESGHSGCLWQGRFYSGVVENVKEVLAVVAGYIDCNPVRARLVRRVGSWRWCGFAMAINGDVRCQEMCMKMLGCGSWDEARAVMESVYADRIPDGVDAERLLNDGSDAEYRSQCGGENGCTMRLRASQTIRIGLSFMKRGGYIGRGMAFGRSVVAQLPKGFPAAGFWSLGFCERLDWELPVVGCAA